MRKFIALLALLASSAAFADETISISNVQVEHQYPNQTITGLAHNETGRNLRNVVVKFKLYDESGALVGNSMTVVQDLGPGEDWKFTAPATVKFANLVVSEARGS